MLNTKFTKQVFLPKLQADGVTPVLENEKMVPGEPLGTFSFKRPTIKDEMNMGLQRARFIGDLDPKTLTDELQIMVEFNVRFPLLCVQAPDGWNWDECSSAEALAIYMAYSDGLAELRK